MRSQFSIRTRDNHALGVTLGRYRLSWSLHIIEMFGSLVVSKVLHCYVAHFTESSHVKNKARKKWPSHSVR